MIRFIQSASVALALTFTACAPAATGGAEAPKQAFQTERVHEAGHVKLWIPPTWTVEDGADSLVLNAPDGTVSIGVTVIDGKDLGTALIGVAASALAGYDELSLVGSPVSGKINGMDALFQDGRGRYHGGSVELSVGVIDTPAQDKYLLVVGEAASGQLAAHEETIRKVIDGIKPI